MKTPTEKCRMCEGRLEFSFEATVLQRYSVAYYWCSSCGFLQTEEPYWLDEAYKQPVNISDTGILRRNLELSSRAAAIVLAFFDRRGTFVDYGGGYGVFTRRMRDLGFDFLWTDPNTENLLARGFEYHPKKTTIEAVTAFEVFEHFTRPLVEIDRIVQIAPNVVFSTELLPGGTVPPVTWWYYGFEHGQHVSFYSLRTLKRLADRLGLSLCSNGRDFHMLTTRHIPKYLFRWVLRLRHGVPMSAIEFSLGSKTSSDMMSFKR